MKREDFVFDHMDDEYEDYWFKVVGDTKGFIKVGHIDGVINKRSQPAK